MTHDTNPPPKAFGAFAAELCATLIARNKLLAMLLKPFLDYLQRTMAAFESLLAAMRAGQFTPPSAQAPSAPAARSTAARPTSVPAPHIAAPRAILRRPRQPRAPDAPRLPSAPRPPIITRHRPRFTLANTPPASFRFFAPSQRSGRTMSISLR